MIVEPASVGASVRAFTLSILNIPETTKPIAIKFYLKHHLGGGKVALGFGQVGLELWFPWQQIAPIEL